MSRMASRAIVLAVARVANYGLMLVSPVILVRVLSIADYGSYRGYLAYVTVLVGIATFSAYESQLYFLPRHARHRWRVVRHTVQIVGLSSLTVVLATAAIDILANGRLIGPFLLPLSIYVLVCVNLDFWEWYWISDHRPVPVFLYTSGRLAARMLVVISAAVLTQQVEVIIWCLIALESLRCAGSWFAWRRAAGARDREQVTGLMREQLQFCLVSGFAVLIATLSRNIGNLAVLQWLGVVPLALYATGLYGEPIIVAVRNSISAILLPEMVRRSVNSRQEAIDLWRGATVANCILLFPVATLIVHFAQPLVAQVFGQEYAQSAQVLQLYSLVIARECFDLTLPLRAMNVTAPLVRSSLLGLVTNALMLWLLLPMGIRGAILAMIAAALVEMVFQGWCVKRLAGIGPGGLFPMGGVGRVLLSAVAAWVVLLWPGWGTATGFLGIVAASGLYLVAYAVLLHLFRVPELRLFRDWLDRRRSSGSAVN